MKDNSTIRIGALLSAVSLALVFSACTTEEPGADSEATTPDEETQTVGAQCRTFGNPVITKGCSSGEVCQPVACTNSIPPSCVGTCVAAPAHQDHRCDITGNPPVTTGCDADEECVPEACTNSIPPHCFGHCE